MSARWRVQRTIYITPLSRNVEIIAVETPIWEARYFFRPSFTYTYTHITYLRIIFISNKYNKLRVLYIFNNNAERERDVA